MMNTAVEQGLRQVALADKYRADSGTVYMTGTQALVRLPMLQQVRDQAVGLNTAGYISGYRGSPVGAYDQMLARAKADLDAHQIKFTPGTNEDLAATAIWGTQQLNCFPGARFDGVFGIWYGKGPGVDRSGDVLRHANQAGSSKHGGVLALAGDDHGAKSSTMAAQTDFMFVTVSMPVLAPASLQDYLDLGIHGFALSRFSGLWTGFKAVTDTIETAGIVDVAPDRVKVILPTDIELPPGGLNLRWPEETFLKLEERLTRYKIPAALAYARANRLNRNVFGRSDAEPARLGLISTGKTYLDLMQALADLGIDDASARRLGLRVFKVDMVWPLEPETARAFCAGCEQILVIEEKRSLIESQLKEILYGLSQRPQIIGKRDERDQPLLPEYGELSPAMLARLLAARIEAFADRPDNDGGTRDSSVSQRIKHRIAALDDKETRPRKIFESIERIPYFCSGCPHNSSTKVPEGSRALAGIGCHYMAQWMDRSTATFTHMGGEGMTWVGQAPFSDTKHIFQNLGDGTYFHSGSLAIRHALASKTRMTYKILFNDAVAMTGGQNHDGQLTPASISRQVKAEGVQKVVVVTDEPQKYPAGYFEADVAVHHRSKLDDVQRELREFDGLSVLIYDQTCAAEKRRRRKRGAFPDPEKRAFINQSVCEGCGDCGVQSNCVSIEPVETEFGRKRVINQSSCNKDFSCVSGFCPSFVTVEGGKLRKGKSTLVAADAVNIGLPAVQSAEIVGSYALIVTGIGGTGVVTIGQILGMAAHLEGKAVTVLDMAGLAQKNGAVMSFVRFAHRAEDLHAPRIGVAAADAVIGGDVVVTAGRDALTKYRFAHTKVVANVARTPTADFTRNTEWTFPLGAMEAAITDSVGEGNAWFVDASRLATSLLGDSIAGNLFLLGFAFQRGMLPVSAAAIERAIELNEVAIELNKSAFLWGRRAAVDLIRVEGVAAPVKSVPVARPMSESLDETIARRVVALTDYQNQAYAEHYLNFIQKTRAVEDRVLGGAAKGLPLCQAVAANLYKLMAYKDEYEVARLYCEPAFQERLGQQFEGEFRLKFHLAPPLLSKRNTKGELQKSEYGPWIMSAFRVLARFKWLRGSGFDPFGRTEERRNERQLIADYETTLTRLLTQMSPENHALAVEIASLPEKIRGFGHVKERSLETFKKIQQELLARWDVVHQTQIENQLERVS
jgi:indolepyruvate ferredoxin oxidoreductase